MNLAERIDLMLRERPATKAELSRIAGVSKNAVKLWVDGTTQEIAFKYAKNIETAWGYRAEWIASGEKPMTVRSSVTPEMRSIIEDLIELDHVGGARRDDVIYFIRRLMPQKSGEKAG